MVAVVVVEVVPVVVVMVWWEKCIWWCTWRVAPVALHAVEAPLVNDAPIKVISCTHA